MHSVDAMLDSTDYRSLSGFEPVSYQSLQSVVGGNGRMSPASAYNHSYASLAPLQPLPPISTVTSPEKYPHHPHHHHNHHHHHPPPPPPPPPNVSGTFTLMHQGAASNLGK